MSKLPFPVAVLDQSAVFLGKTRSGKSSKLRLIVEYLLDANKPVGIIDPKGDWWGIKSSADGKSAGYKVVIFGGEHADVPIDRHSGKAVAELVAAANRPYIVDLKGWRVGDRTQFFIDFAETLFRLTKGHRWLVIDEVHNFAPQGKILSPQAGEMLHWANRLASEGSGMGLLLLSASQRPQKVHKDFLTSHETLFALRVVHKLDRDADKDWIDGCGDPALGKQVLDSLAQMQRTQGWVWSPEIGFGPKLIDFPMFATYDSFKPQAQRQGKLKGWASVDLDDVKSKLAAVIEKNKADDPKALRTQLAARDTRIRQLEADVAARSSAMAKPDKDALAAAEQKGFDQAKKKLVSSATRAVSDIMRATMTAVDTRLRQSFAEAKEKLVDDLKQLASLSKVAGVEITFEPSAPAAPQQTARPVQQKPAAVPRPPREPSAEGDGTLTNAMLETLGALAWWAAIGFDTVTRAQLGARLKIAPGGSTMRSRLAPLSKAALIDYPSGDTVRMTDAGRQAAPPPDLGGTLLETIRASLTAVERETFDAIPPAPAAITRAGLGVALNIEPGGSTMRSRLAPLSKRELIYYPDKDTVARQDWVTDEQRAAA